MKFNSNHRAQKIALFFILSVCGLALMSCDDTTEVLTGNSGADGAAGATGATGAAGNDFVGGSLDLSDSVVLAQMIEDENRVTASITDVSMGDGHPVNSFTITDSNGYPLINLPTNKVRFTFVKLEPSAGTGQPAKWRSYLPSTESSTTSADNTAGSPDAVTTALQATTDSTGTLVELGAGEYTYTFAKDVSNVTSPVTVTYEPTLTHRVGMQMSLNSAINPDNPTYTFVPDGSAVTVQKDMADTVSCNRCHDRLALHGGGRFTTDYCVTCHNPYMRDEDSGANLGMAAMVHGIHSAAYRTQLEGEATAVGNPDSGELSYKIYGYQEALTDFSEVTFPQSTLFCESCHEESDSRPQGDLWKTVVSTEACGGCHADGVTDMGANATTGLSEFRFTHPSKTGGIGGTDPQADSDCNLCHSGDAAASMWSERPIDPLNAHNQGLKKGKEVGEENFLYQITNVTNFGASQYPVVTFKISNPETDTDYNFLTNSAFNTGAGTKATFNILYAWETGDFGNVGGGNYPNASSDAGEYPGYPVRIAIDAIKANAVDNGDGTYTLDTADVAGINAIPASVTSEDIQVWIDGYPLADLDNSGTISSADKVPVKAALYSTGTARRTIVSINNCNNCHKQLTMHGRNRTDEPRMCAGCHNPDATDIIGRDGWGSPDPLDDRGEQAIALGFMIHGIHKGSIALAGTDFSEVTYPQETSNCTTCHTGTTYYGNAGDARPVTVGTGLDIADPDDDEAISANAAMCYPCHDSAAAKAHMELNGAVIPDGDPNTCDVPGACTVAEGNRPLKGDIGDTPASVESCSVCHGSGRAADIAVVHGLE